jgi:hypothetical protein
MAHPDRLTSPRHRVWSALLAAGLVCASPWLTAAEEDLSRDEAKQKLNQTEQELQSSRVKAEGLSKDLAALAEEPMVGPALESQVAALGFLALLAGVAGVTDRRLGPRAAQVATALIGWLILAGIVLVGPLADLMQGPAQSAIVRFAAHANPLVVAERGLGLDWLHQSLTYRLTPLGESYAYLLGDLAWWKTALGHFFVGSGLIVFGATGLRRRQTR